MCEPPPAALSAHHWRPPRPRARRATTPPLIDSPGSPATMSAPGGGGCVSRSSIKPHSFAPARSSPARIPTSTFGFMDINTFAQRTSSPNGSPVPLYFFSGRWIMARTGPPQRRSGLVPWRVSPKSCSNKWGRTMSSRTGSFPESCNAPSLLAWLTVTSCSGPSG